MSDELYSADVALAISVAHWIPRLFDKEDIAIWITDTEKFVQVNQYGNFKVDFKSGDPLKPGGTPAKILATQERISRLVPPEVYGVACRSIGIPISGGVLGVSFSVDSEEKLQADIGHLDSVTKALNETGAAIATRSRTLAEFMVRVRQDLELTRKEVQGVEAVGDLISTIADDTRYISLNALIEAKRVGESGRAFSVVANEMRTLSRTTADSMRKVKQDLESIRKRFEVLNGAVAQAAGDVDNQSDGAQTIARGLGEILAAISSIEAAARHL